MYYLNNQHSEILKLAAKPISRKKIQNKLSLSHQQLRRYTTELVDKRLLHSYKRDNEFICSERGYTYLAKLSLMSKKVYTIFPDENIHMILLLMNTYKISRIVVIEHNKPIGIVTSRDLLPLAALLPI